MDISQISNAPPVQSTPISDRQANVTGIPPAISMATNNDTPVAAPSQAATVDSAALNQAINAINKFIQPIVGNIEFSIDHDSGRTLIKVVDTATNTVIRQTPSREVLAIAKELDKLQGLLIREKA